MLYTERSGSLQGGDAGRRHREISASGLRLYTIEMVGGLTFDSRISAPIWVRPEPSRSRLGVFQVVMRGHLHVARDSTRRTLGVGDALAEPASPWRERWEGESFAVLVCQWDAAHHPLPQRRQLGRVSTQDLKFFETVANDLREPLTQERASRLASKTLRRLGCLGLAPADAPRSGIIAMPRNDVPPPAIQNLAGAMNAAFTNLSARPMWVDATDTVGFSERHLRRQLGAYNKWINSSASFRQRLLYHRLSTAACLLSRSDSIETVARSVGYGSNRALAHALVNAGMPSPAELCRALRTGS